MAPRIVHSTQDWLCLVVVSTGKTSAAQTIYTAVLCQLTGLLSLVSSWASEAMLDLKSSFFWYLEMWLASKTILCGVFQQGLPVCWRRIHISLPFPSRGSWCLAFPGEDIPVV